MYTESDRRLWLIKGAVFGVMAGLVLSPVLHFAFQAVNGKVSTNESLAYFSWYYVLGTLFAFSTKAVKGAARYLPINQYNVRHAVGVFAWSIPALIGSVFVFLPLYGPVSNNPQQDLFKAFFTAHYFIGFGQSLHEYKALLVHLSDRFGNKNKKE